ncbi:MAG: hypothetical protein GY944_12805 [bacterium]|nr:hypothetical protein [bacterium]
MGLMETHGRRVPNTHWATGFCRALATAMGAAIAIVAGLATPAAADEAPAAWYERIDFGGDFRARDEVLVIEGMKDRHRLRYRLRMGAKTEINDHVDVGFRLATGPDANSGNQTLGSGVDFDPDGIFIDRAYITIAPHGGEKPIFGDSLTATFGKSANPFKTKGIGPSLLIWDGDQMPEGAAFQWSASPRDCWETNFDAAYYVIDEEEIDPSRDPAIMAFQLDNAVKVTDQIKLTTHVSYFGLRKLNDDFFTRVADRGNTAGLTSNQHVDLIEFHGGTTWSGSEDWPVTVWGNVLLNLSADGIGEGKQNTAFGAGIEIGNKKTTARIGAAYFQIEADAVPGVLADSDVLDGLTNGESWMVYLTRQIFTNTDFQLVTYISEPLDDDVARLQDETLNDRVRIQTNVIVKF